MPETHSEKIARLKAAEAASAEREIILVALTEELENNGCVYPELAERVFENDLKHLSVRNGKVIGVRDLVAAHRAEYPESFRGPNPAKVGGTPLPGSAPPRGRGAVQPREAEPRVRGMVPPSALRQEPIGKPVVPLKPPNRTKM